MLCGVSVVVRTAEPFPFTSRPGNFRAELELVSCVLRKPPTINRSFAAMCLSLRFGDCRLRTLSRLCALDALDELVCVTDYATLSLCKLPSERVALFVFGARDG